MEHTPTHGRRDALQFMAASFLAVALPGCVEDEKSDRERVGAFIGQIREQVGAVMDEGDKRTPEWRLTIYRACERRLRRMREGNHWQLFLDNPELDREANEIQALIQRAIDTVDPPRPPAGPVIGPI